MTAGCKNSICFGTQVVTVGQRGANAMHCSDGVLWEYFLHSLIAPLTAHFGVVQSCQ